MQAIILAGGRGERLRPLTDTLPKPMLPVGGKPVLWHQIMLLKKHGIADIVICGNYLFDSIRDYFGDGSAFGVGIRYIRESEPMGTGGPVKLAEGLLRGSFVLMMGDVMTNLDIAGLISFHEMKAGAATLVLRETDHPEDSDIVQLDSEGRVVRFFFKNENSKLGNLGNAGVFVFARSILDHIPEGPCNLERDVLAPLAAKEAMYGFVTSGYVRDMGTFERYGKVKSDFERGVL